MSHKLSERNSQRFLASRQRVIGRLETSELNKLKGYLMLLKSSQDLLDIVLIRPLLGNTIYLLIIPLLILMASDLLKY